MAIRFSPVTYGAHFDFPRNWLLQLAGTKRFVLLPPTAAVAALGYDNNASSPSWRQASSPFLRDVVATGGAAAKAVGGLQGWLRPGDALFIPPGWFHYIEAAPPAPPLAPAGTAKHTGGAAAEDDGGEFWLSINRFCAGGI
eukprot:SAG22_NODE_1330_length_4709_cov_25.747722_2_plen_141_part_00